ncbi:uncharacterized protein LOC129229576 isoform X2 [Uloborus diversus]|uniref:uncharacterized protein LOC129229576 isoform X2 n=1 Tax=Uloborus diversus TaxID=327109 RepID=UPI0024099FE5|nr:uncharacterized protein LOC129229576 isoform X2 [Uloborus diversus]
MFTNRGKLERLVLKKFSMFNSFVYMKVMNSKFLKNIIKCLNENSHSHMLKRRGSLEFEITFKHMKDPTWQPEDISLFIEMDFLYKPKRQENKKFFELCKGRFKANMRKLCDLGVLKEEVCDESDPNMKKSVKKKRYRFMKMYDELIPTTEEKMAKKAFLDACKDIDEENTNILSHFLCLSNNANHGVVHLNPNEKEVEPLLFETGKSIQETMETLHSYIECSRNKEMEIIMFAENVEHQPLLPVCKDMKDDREIQNKVIVFSDVQHHASKEMEVVTDMLGETEESVDLNKFLIRYEPDDEPQSGMKNKLEMESSTDPFLPNVYEDEHPCDDAMLLISELKTCGSVFSFSQNDEDILSIYG